jgi:hypothetical protein
VPEITEEGERHRQIPRPSVDARLAQRIAARTMVDQFFTNFSQKMPHCVSRTDERQMPLYQRVLLVRFGSAPYSVDAPHRKLASSVPAVLQARLGLRLRLRKEIYDDRQSLLR